MSVVLPTSLHPDEQILREGSGTHLRTTPTGLGYNIAVGYCWLTTHRLIMRPQGAIRAGPVTVRFGPVTYPISRIVNAEIIPMKVQWSNSNVLRLEFDNGGKEYFDLHREVNAWRQAILQARTAAPVLPYETAPAVKSGVEDGLFADRRVICVRFDWLHRLISGWCAAQQITEALNYEEMTL